MTKAIPTKIIAAPIKSNVPKYDDVPTIIIPLITPITIETLSLCMSLTVKTIVKSIEIPVTIMIPHWSKVGTTKWLAGKNIGMQMLVKKTN